MIIRTFTQHNLSYPWCCRRVCCHSVTRNIWENIGEYFALRISEFRNVLQEIADLNQEDGDALCNLCIFEEDQGTRRLLVFEVHSDNTHILHEVRARSWWSTLGNYSGNNCINILFLTICRRWCQWDWYWPRRRWWRYVPFKWWWGPSKRRYWGLINNSSGARPAQHHQTNKTLHYYNYFYPTFQTDRENDSNVNNQLKLD